MDITILVALAATVFALIIGFIIFLRKPAAEKPAENRARLVPNRLRDGAPRRAQLARNRNRLRPNNAGQQDDASSDDEDAPPARDLDVEFPDGKLGAKKKAKLEAKAEKKAQREAEQLSRQEKKQKEQKAEEERLKEREKEDAEEKQREEEERKAKEEKERRENDEYLKMKAAFSVEEEGYEEGEDGNEANLLQEFIGYIKKNKIVVIEDLAAHFKLKTQATIDRIKDLQKDDLLTGVIDDRGKFIYVSQDEMNAVAKFIRQRGRVSIAELAESSNQLINLTTVGASN